MDVVVRTKLGVWLIWCAVASSYFSKNELTEIINFSIRRFWCADIFFPSLQILLSFWTVYIKELNKTTINSLVSYFCLTRHFDEYVVLMDFWYLYVPLSTVFVSALYHVANSLCHFLCSRMYMCLATLCILLHFAIFIGLFIDYLSVNARNRFDNTILILLSLL